MDKRIAIPTAALLTASIAAEALLLHHKPDPHIEAPKAMAPFTPGPRPLPDGVVINQIA